MAWLLLLAAGLFEVGWAVGLKYTDGFTRLYPSLLTAASMAISVILLAMAVRELPLGTAYAVWTGIGAAGTFILGVAVFGDALNWGRALGVAMIIGGVVVLKAMTP